MWVASSICLAVSLRPKRGGADFLGRRLTFTLVFSPLTCRGGRQWHASARQHRPARLHEPGQSAAPAVGFAPSSCAATHVDEGDGRGGGLDGGLGEGGLVGGPELLACRREGCKPPALQRAPRAGRPRALRCAAPRDSSRQRAPAQPTARRTEEGGGVDEGVPRLQAGLGGVAAGALRRVGGGEAAVRRRGSEAAARGGEVLDAQVQHAGRLLLSGGTQQRLTLTTTPPSGDLESSSCRPRGLSTSTCAAAAVFAAIACCGMAFSGPPWNPQQRCVGAAWHARGGRATHGDLWLGAGADKHAAGGALGAGLAQADGAAQEGVLW